MSSTKSSPRDFSLFSLFTAGLACLVPLASAYTQPVGAEPKGNPISQPGLASVLPVGVNFTITWNPTTDGTVSLVLLKGPSENIKPLYAIAEKIDNSGSYVWAPKKDLAPGPTLDTGYGIQLIVDKDGQYQYTTQFGISNPDYVAGAWSSSSSSSTTSAKATTSAESTSTLASVYKHAANATSAGAVWTTSASAVGSIGTSAVPYPAGNTSAIYPTGSMSVPSSLMTSLSSATGTGSGSRISGGSGASATASQSSPISTGAASTMATSFVGLVVAAGVAVFAL